MVSKIQLLKFWSNGDKTVDGRKLVGHAQPTDGMGRLADSVYDCFDTQKPTYYFNPNGSQVSYFDHAKFIADNSFEDFNNGRWWVYPMLTFEDRGEYNAVILKITYYERKPVDAPEAKLTNI